MENDDEYKKLSTLSIQGDATKKDAQIADLQAEIQQLENGNNEDRFVFGLIILILLDVIFFSHTDGWGAPLAILILELIVIMMMAKRLGVEEITNILDKYILNGYLKK